MKAIANIKVLFCQQSYSNPESLGGEFERYLGTLLGPLI